MPQRRQITIANVNEPKVNFNFTLAEQSTVDVWINGVQLDVSAFTLDQKGQSITLKNPPRERDEIAIQARTPVVRTSEFNPGSPLNSGALNSEFDNIQDILSEHKNDNNRALKLAPSQSTPLVPVPRPQAGRLLIGRTDGNGWENTQSDFTLLANSSSPEQAISNATKSAISTVRSTSQIALRQSKIILYTTEKFKQSAEDFKNHAGLSARSAQSAVQTAQAKASQATNSATLANQARDQTIEAKNTVLSRQVRYLEARTAANKAEKFSTSAQSAATQASASKTQASTSAAQASASKTQASTSAAHAYTSAAQASASKTQATRSANLALESERIAQAQASQATNSATLANQARDLTIEAKNTVLSKQALYSGTTAAINKAKVYAGEAQSAAGQASTSAAQAGRSATSAQSASGQASTSEAQAGRSATSAQSAAGQASTSAVQAGRSAISAQRAAGQASTSVVQAGRSVSKAESQAATAVTAARGAHLSETAAAQYLRTIQSQSQNIQPPDTTPSVTRLATTSNINSPTGTNGLLTNTALRLTLGKLMKVQTFNWAEWYPGHTNRYYTRIIGSPEIIKLNFKITSQPSRTNPLYDLERYEYQLEPGIVRAPDNMQLNGQSRTMGYFIRTIPSQYMIHFGRYIPFWTTQSGPILIDTSGTTGEQEDERLGIKDSAKVAYASIKFRATLAAFI